VKLFLPGLLLACVTAGASQPLTSTTPVRNFKLPTFTTEGYRSMLLLGSEAVVSADQITVANLNLTLFKGDEADTIETVILSPSAIAAVDARQVQGEGTVRVIRDDIEITGQGWTYEHNQKKVSIAHDARVVFRAPTPDILK
jgi:hypothetical protein